jgi:hypothetical protein
MENTLANRFIDSNDGARLAEFPVGDLVAYLWTHNQPAESDAHAANGIAAKAEW